MDGLTKALGNAPTFVIAYLVFMIPTYVLPYAGSNSVVATVAYSSQNASNVPFWLHLLFLALLCGLAWIRGAYVGKRWLVIFPLLAAFFDLMPVFNWIPLIPTIMHLLAIIVGVASSRPATR